MGNRTAIWAMVLTVAFGLSCLSQAPLPMEESLAPYRGPVEERVDHSTLHGTVMCGKTWDFDGHECSMKKRPRSKS